MGKESAGVAGERDSFVIALLLLREYGSIVFQIIVMCFKNSFNFETWCVNAAAGHPVKVVVESAYAIFSLSGLWSHLAPFQRVSSLNTEQSKLHIWACLNTSPNVKLWLFCWIRTPVLTSGMLKGERKLIRPI